MSLSSVTIKAEYDTPTFDEMAKKQARVLKAVTDSIKKEEVICISFMF